MSHSRRTFLAAGATGLTALAATAGAPPMQALDTDGVVAELIQRSETANAALMRGDIDTYLDLITISDDFTLMSPFGGQPGRGPYTREQWDRIGRMFRNGTLKQEVVQAYGSADMVVLAVIEHGYGEVGGTPPQEWPLRVTLVYRRNGSEWQLAHRHADPFVRPVMLERLAWLARGDKDS